MGNIFIEACVNSSEWTNLWIAIFAFLGVVVTAYVSWLNWSKNEKNKRITEEFQRKEEKYAKLIENLRGFYDAIDEEDKSNKDKLKEEFMNQLNLSWMYCSDSVIRKARIFLDKIEEGKSDEALKLVGELVLEIRKNLIEKKQLEKTDLKPEDFKYFKVN